MTVAASQSGGSGLQIPGLDELFPPAVFFKGTIIQMTRIDLVRILVAVVLCVLLLLGARSIKLTQRGRGQQIFEFIMDFIYHNLVLEQLGPKMGRKYFPFLAWIFLSIFALNLTGVIPFLNVSSNSLVAVPMIFAVLAYLAFIIAGIKAHGAGHYFKEELFPEGAPQPVYVLLTPIEFLSTFIVRPFTLTVRLMANMMAGHFLLLAFATMTEYLLVEAGGWLKPVSVLSFLACVVFTGLELFIEALQAYIFTLLAASYIGLAREGV